MMAAYGLVIRNSIYLGEVYDAVISASPGGVLQKAFFPPILVTDIQDIAFNTRAANRNHLTAPFVGIKYCVLSWELTFQIANFSGLDRSEANTI